VRGPSGTRETLELARQSADRSTLWLALLSCIESLFGSPQVEERLAFVEELVELEEASGDPIRSLEGLHDRLYAKAELGDLSGFGHYIDAIETWQPRTGVVNRLWTTDDSPTDPMARLFVMVEFRRSPARFRAFRALVDGRWDEAETLSAKALEETPNDPNGLDAYVAQLFQLRRE
jgi:hypothetical protein